MKIDKFDVITLNDNNKYVVVSKINYEENLYLYLVDINDNGNIKFCLEKEDEGATKLVDVEETALLEKLMPLFTNDVKDILEKITGEDNT